MARSEAVGAESIWDYHGREQGIRSWNWDSTELAAARGVGVGLMPWKAEDAWMMEQRPWLEPRWPELVAGAEPGAAIIRGVGSLGEDCRGSQRPRDEAGGSWDEAWTEPPCFVAGRGRAGSSVPPLGRGELRRTDWKEPPKQPDGIPDDLSKDGEALATALCTIGVLANRDLQATSGEARQDLLVTETKAEDPTPRYSREKEREGEGMGSEPFVPLSQLALSPHNGFLSSLSEGEREEEGDGIKVNAPRSHLPAGDAQDRHVGAVPHSHALLHIKCRLHVKCREKMRLLGVGEG